MTGVRPGSDPNDAIPSRQRIGHGGCSPRRSRIAVFCLALRFGAESGIEASGALAAFERVTERVDRRQDP